MIGFPFDSHVEYDEHGAPSYDRAISSKPLKALIAELFSTGVMPNPSTNLQVEAGSEGMTVIVHPGFCVIEGGLKLEEDDRELVLQEPHTQDRIDTVVMRWNNNDRTCDLYVLTGTPASVPVRPELTQTNSIYEIGLADIFITRNVNYVTNSRITDTRYETGRCGIVSSISEFDTTTITQQIEAMLAEKSDAFDEVIAQDDSDFQTWFESVQEQLSDDVAGRLLTLINNTRSQVGLPDAFDSTHSYAVGDYCIHENILYRCITATTGDWDATKWRATSVVDEMIYARKIVNADGSNKNVGNSSTPVYFSGGVPVVTNIRTPITDKFAVPNTWTAETITDTYNSVVYGGKGFVAVGNSGLHAFSADGVTWSNRTFPTNKTMNGVTYGNGLYVSCGNNGETYYSENGTTWQTGSTTMGSATMNDIAYGNGVFVAVGNSGVNYHSTNGSTWTAGTATGTENLYGVSYGNGMFIACGSGGKIYHSTDGSTWTASSKTAGTITTLHDTACGNGIFVTVGEVGYLYYSNDGAFFNEIRVGTSSFYSITYGNGCFVAVGYNGANYYSKNGIDWTAGSSQSTTLNGVSYGNGVFVAVGSGKRQYKKVTTNLSITDIGTPINNNTQAIEDIAGAISSLNTSLTNSFGIVDVDITATGTYISKAMPSGFTTSNSVILSTSYFNTNNNLWYFNSLDSVVVTIQGSGSASQVSVYTTLTSVTKVKVILYKYV